MSKFMQRTDGDRDVSETFSHLVWNARNYKNPASRNSSNLVFFVKILPHFPGKQCQLWDFILRLEKRPIFIPSAGNPISFSHRIIFGLQNFRYIRWMHRQFYSLFRSTCWELYLNTTGKRHVCSSVAIDARCEPNLTSAWSRLLTSIARTY